MLRNTFIHIPGIGEITERHLWERRITSWDDLLQSLDNATLTSRRHRDHLYLSQQALRAHQVHFFARWLPRKEWWRMYPEFEGAAAFLDIETTGLSSYYHHVTVVGLYDGQAFRCYTRGFNLHRFIEEIRNYDLLVTYNGSSFDLPFLRAEFPGVQFPPVHIDLRHLLRRLGYRGGLKAIEQQLGIQRKESIQGIDGFMAVVLWQRHLLGDPQALQTLMEYNRADVVNIKALMEIAYDMLRDRLLSEKDSQHSVV